MDVTLTKQQCLELAQFLSGRANPSDKFPNVSSSRAAVRVRHQLEQAVQDYSQVFADLVKQDADALKAAQDKLKVWEEELKTQDKAPSPQAKDEFAKPLQEEFNKMREELQAKAIAHEKESGQTMITVELKKTGPGKDPKKDWQAVKDFFETNGQKFPMWNLGDKLNEIAEVFDKT